MTAKKDIDGKQDSNVGSALLGLVADIRAAVGDPSGKLMQDELVEHCRKLAHSADWLQKHMCDPERTLVCDEHHCSPKTPPNVLWLQFRGDSEMYIRAEHIMPLLERVSCNTATPAEVWEWIKALNAAERELRTPIKITQEGALARLTKAKAREWMHALPWSPQWDWLREEMAAAIGEPPPDVPEMPNPMADLLGILGDGENAKSSESAGRKKTLE